MFAVTKRLLLRPGWIEEAPALTEAIADVRIARNTSRMPWPYRLEDAEEFLAREPDLEFPHFQIIDRTVDPVRIVGGVGFKDGGDAPEIGYWLTPDSWGRGFATEAAAAAIAAVRASLGYRRIIGGHFIDNPASGRVLEKLGFRRTGSVVPMHSIARNREVDCVMFELDEEDMAGTVAPALAA